jgi:citrate lyase beta subunit
MTDILRSLLFVPGSRPERFSKAYASSADLVCIDLEDAVLPEQKEAARHHVKEFLEEGNTNICIRVNPVNSLAGQHDIKILCKVNPDFIMIAKCSGTEDIAFAEEILKGTSTQIIALVETLEGLDNATEIAACSRVSALMFGGADMSAELRCEFAYEPLLLARSQLVISAAKANVDLIDVPYIDINDDVGLLVETKKVASLGYTAKAAIHPKQIETIHKALTPTDSEVAYAQSVLSAVENADSGVVVVNGRMVDRPIILSSQRIIKLANVATQ